MMPIIASTDLKVRGYLTSRLPDDKQPTAKVKQTKNKPFNKTSYEKQRNLETNHPNRNQYPFGHRHYAWSEFVPLSGEQ